MTFVKFLKPFDYRPSDNRYVTIAYPAGYEGEVDQACADLAIAKGAAEEIEDEFTAFIESLSDDEADDEEVE